MTSKAAVAIMRSKLPFPVGPTDRAIKTLVAIPNGRRMMFTPNACRVLGNPKLQFARFLSVVDINSCPSDPERTPYRQRVVPVLQQSIPGPAQELASFEKLVVCKQMVFEQDY
jgi:hypothetical protein